MTDESKFPTINDYVLQLQRLVALGLGELPLQVLVAPPSTLEAINRQFKSGGPGSGYKALLVELYDDSVKTGRLPPSILSSGYVAGGGQFGRVPLSGKAN